MLGRLAIGGLVVAVHVLLIRALSVSGPALPEQTAHDEVTTYLVLLAREPLHTLAPRLRARGRAAPAVAGRGTAKQAMTTSPVGAPPLSTPPMSTRPKRRPSIDWEKEGEKAAEDSLAAEDRTRRQAAALGFPAESRILKQDPPPPPEFNGWSEAHLHRVQAIPGVGILVRLNDRCFLLFAGLAILPGCTLGHPDVHGDLFAHMKDPRDPSVPQLPPVLPGNAPN